MWGHVLAQRRSPDNPGGLSLGGTDTGWRHSAGESLETDPQAPAGHLAGGKKAQAKLLPPLQHPPHSREPHTCTGTAPCPQHPKNLLQQTLIWSLQGQAHVAVHSVTGHSTPRPRACRTTPSTGPARTARGDSGVRAGGLRAPHRHPRASSSSSAGALGGGRQIPPPPGLSLTLRQAGLGSAAPSSSCEDAGPFCHTGPGGRLPPGTAEVKWAPAGTSPPQGPSAIQSHAP